MSVMDKMFHPLKYNKMMNSKAKIGIFIDDEKKELYMRHLRLI